MHLGLNRGALCAPYRIMGAVAPRHKILITSWSKKGTQIYYFFSLKSPHKRTPTWFASGAPMERNTRLEGIYTSLKKPNKNSSNKKALEIEPVHVPKMWGPYGKRHPFPSLPVRSPPSSIFQKPRYTNLPPSQTPGSSQYYKGPYVERCPYLETI